jgi:hypothetical protein
MPSPSELIVRFPLVRYVPIPQEVGHYSSSPSPSEPWGDSPVQSIYLEAHNARCDICLVDYEPPRSTTSPDSHIVVGVESEPLRRLPCSHVFHVRQPTSTTKSMLNKHFTQKSCIDNWLLGTAGESTHRLVNSTCPSCRAEVFEMEANGRRIASSRPVSIWQPPAVHTGQESAGLLPASPVLTGSSSHLEDSRQSSPVPQSVSNHSSHSTPRSTQVPLPSVTPGNHSGSSPHLPLAVPRQAEVRGRSSYIRNMLKSFPRFRRRKGYNT